MDPVDRAKIEEMRFRDEALRQQLESDQADEQLVVDDVVICKDCGYPIPENRLMAKPNATLCVDCKQLQEMKERR